VEALAGHDHEEQQPAFAAGDGADASHPLRAAV
jgi:hypothetical protein